MTGATDVHRDEVTVSGMGIDDVSGREIEMASDGGAGVIDCDCSGAHSHGVMGIEIGHYD